MQWMQFCLRSTFASKRCGADFTCGRDDAAAAAGSLVQRCIKVLFVSKENTKKNDGFLPLL